MESAYLNPNQNTQLRHSSLSSCQVIRVVAMAISAIAIVVLALNQSGLLSIELSSIPSYSLIGGFSAVILGLALSYCVKAKQVTPKSDLSRVSDEKWPLENVNERLVQFRRNYPQFSSINCEFKRDDGYMLLSQWTGTCGWTFRIPYLIAERNSQQMTDFSDRILVGVCEELSKGKPGDAEEFLINQLSDEPLFNIERNLAPILGWCEKFFSQCHSISIQGRVKSPITLRLELDDNEVKFAKVLFASQPMMSYGANLAQTKLEGWHHPGLSPRSIALAIRNALHS